MKNPFLMSGYISAEYFCDRKDDTAKLVKMLTNGNNVVLVSPRRMGKTGLIEHCFHHKEISKKYYTFFVDIYATTSLQEFVYKLGKEIFEQLKPKGKKFIEHFFSIISSLRPAFKLDEVTGSPVFDIGIGEIRSAEFTLEEIFTYLNAADKPCIVAIDEFQQIAKYSQKNIEAILRTHVQKAVNANFVFSGSQRHILQNMFFSASQPFYQSAVLQSLAPINKSEYIKFASNHFKKANKNVDIKYIERTYDIFEGHTFYVQAVLNQLFSELNEFEDCTDKILEKAITNRTYSYENIFSEMLNLLSEKQKEFLYAVAKEGKTVNITSGEFVKKHSLHSASSAQTAAKQLLNKEILTRQDGIYSIYDRFLGLWIKSYFGVGINIHTLP
jgi:AAA+ ATPase superfamily predicted ATPase